jgi:hypothetical protein
MQRCAPLEIIHLNALNYRIPILQYCTVRRSVPLRGENAISASGGARLLPSAAPTNLYYDQRNVERETAKANCQHVLVLKYVHVALVQSTIRSIAAMVTYLSVLSSQLSDATLASQSPVVMRTNFSGYSLDEQHLAGSMQNHHSTPKVASWNVKRYSSPLRWRRLGWS